MRSLADQSAARDLLGGTAAFVKRAAMREERAWQHADDAAYQEEQSYKQGLESLHGALTAAGRQAALAWLATLPLEAR